MANLWALEVIYCSPLSGAPSAQLDHCSGYAQSPEGLSLPEPSPAQRSSGELAFASSFSVSFFGSWLVPASEHL